MKILLLLLALLAAASCQVVVWKEDTAIETTGAAAGAGDINSSPTTPNITSALAPN